MLWGIGNKEHLDIDYCRHVEYLQSTKRVLQRRLKERFGAPRAAALWVRAQHIYEDFVREMPYTGGRRNLQAHALYDSIMCFAYWEAMPEGRRETVEEFEETVALVFNGDVSKARRKPEWLTANNEPLLRAIAPIGKLAFCLQNRVVRSGIWNNAWECRMSSDERAPLHVELIGCPIADFARSHGYQHLMPAMCNPDHHSMTDFGMYLVRPSVVGRGDALCDYYIMGDRTSTALASPAKPDEQGFLMNQLPEV